MESQGNKYVMPLSQYNSKLMQDIDDAELLDDLLLSEKPATEVKPISPARSAAGGDAWSDEDDEEDGKQLDILGVKGRKIDGGVAAAAPPAVATIIADADAGAEDVPAVSNSRPAVGRASSAPVTDTESAGLADALAENARLKKEIRYACAEAERCVLGTCL